MPGTPPAELLAPTNELDALHSYYEQETSLDRL